MRVEVRSDRVIVDGYVNAVERESELIITARGKCREKIAQGAFRAALEKANNVLLLLNHKTDNVYASLANKSLNLFEDNIGLRAIAEITDPEIMEKAKNGELRGWSFGMVVNQDDYEEREGQEPLRTVRSLDLFEVSLIDRAMKPCYSATSVEARADDGALVEKRSISTKVVTSEMVETPKEPIDYSELEERLNAVK